MKNPYIPYKITNSCGYNIFQWEVYFVERMTPPIIKAVPSFYDFLLKIVLKDLDEYNTFVFEKLTKVHGIVKMQSLFVLSEIKYKTELNIKP